MGEMDWAYSRALTLWALAMEGRGRGDRDVQVHQSIHVPALATALREAHEAGRREGLEAAARMVSALTAEIAQEPRE